MGKPELSKSMEQKNVFQELKRQARAAQLKRNSYVSWKMLLDNKLTLIVPTDGVKVVKPPKGKQKFPMAVYTVGSYLLLNENYEKYRSATAPEGFIPAEKGGLAGVNYFETPSNEYFFDRLKEAREEGKALIVIMNYEGQTGPNDCHMYSTETYKKEDPMYNVYVEAIKG